MENIEIMPINQNQSNDTFKRPRGRPRKIRVETEPVPKNPRGRPRKDKTGGIEKPRKIPLSKKEHNKLYIERHPIKRVFCDICQKEYLFRNIKLHNQNKIHLSNLFKKMQV